MKCGAHPVPLSFILKLSSTHTKLPTWSLPSGCLIEIVYTLAYLPNVCYTPYTSHFIALTPGEDYKL